MHLATLRRFAAVLAAVVLTGWGNLAHAGEQGSETTLDTAPLVRHIILPQDTDPQIDTALDPHYVWLDPAQQPNPMLWVFLPASNPALHQLISMEAARLGYHAINLMYVTKVSPGAVCNRMRDDQARMTCYENIRLQTIDGIARSNLTDVNPPNSIYNRLTKLLQYLAINFPGEGWGRFLVSGEPRWSHIVIGGFSQGGGNAAMIAKLHEVARVVTTSSPTDGLIDRDEGARWVAIEATPAERHYGLAHQREFDIRPIRANWNALGLGVFGAPVVPETSAAPYGCTHMLLTDLLPATGSYNDAHGSTSRDDFTPRLANGTPALRDAWRYMLGASEEQESQSTANGEGCDCDDGHDRNCGFDELAAQPGRDD
jgi:hypothetical protein